MAVKKAAPAKRGANKKTAATKSAASKVAPAKTVAAGQAPSAKAPASSSSVGKVAVGKKIPAFSSLVTGGGSWKSSAAAGKNLVIYFYPRDNTPGCTKEGEAFRDLAPAFAKANAAILGVSPDSVASHEKFKTKFGFPFELLSDEEQQLCQLFDVWREKSLYGRKFMGVERSTFLIDSNGVLRQEWRRVKVPGHAEAVLEAAKAL